MTNKNLMRILSGIQPSGVLHCFVIPSGVEESLTAHLRAAKEQ